MGEEALEDIISIHAPPRGATRLDAQIPHRLLISIHAPPRGATLTTKHMAYRRKYFNSRPSARGDLLRYNQIATPDVFQFTPLREGRHFRGMTEHCIFAFQFTPLREGRRHQRAARNANQDISIHAPPRGATAKDMQFLQIFCSTLTNQHGLTIMPRNLSRLFW